MSARPWTTGELQVMRIYAGLGVNSVALLLERSVTSVESKARELRVSLQITNEDIDVSTAPGRLLVRLREAVGLQICPMCGKRLATMRETGMCRCCHLDQLITLRETQLAEEVRLRKLTKLRQDKHRLRICDSCNEAFFPRANSPATRCPDCGGSE